MIAWNHWLLNTILKQEHQIKLIAERWTHWTTDHSWTNYTAINTHLSIHKTIEPIEANIHQYNYLLVLYMVTITLYLQLIYSCTQYGLYWLSPLWKPTSIWNVKFLRLIGCFSLLSKNLHNWQGVLNLNYICKYAKLHLYIYRV